MEEYTPGTTKLQFREGKISLVHFALQAYACAIVFRKNTE